MCALLVNTILVLPRAMRILLVAACAMKNSVKNMGEVALRAISQFVVKTVGDAPTDITPKTRGSVLIV